MIVLEAGCTSPNIWQGVGSSCTPDPCLEGACCLGYYCLLTFEPDCLAYLGHFLGNATICDPNPCPSSSITLPASNSSSLRVWAMPNPGRGQTVLRYELPAAVTATLRIFDAEGSVVRRFTVSPRTDGQGAMRWDGRDDTGRRVSAGVYLVRLTTSAGEASGRLVLTR